LLMSQCVTKVEVDDPGILRDVDTPEDLRNV
jgi:molybdenum cofactor cytidylyltransferase